MNDARWISALEASRHLAVSRATLYAYVSRGYIRSQAAPGSTRTRVYSLEDVGRVRRQSEERRQPAKAAAHALDWGMPVLESAISFIDGARLYYRGHDAVALSRSRGLADVASLIWIGRFDAASLTQRSQSRRSPRTLDATAPFMSRAQAALARASARDGASDLRPDAVAATGWHILQLLASTAGGSGFQESRIEAALARAWRTNATGVGLLRSALILSADHELNVSSFTARCVASAGSNPYAVAIAGLAALEGVRHGGAGARVDSMLQAIRRERSLSRAIADRLRRGEPIDGFGHPLYRDGDPRAKALLAQLAEEHRRSSELTFVLDVVDATSAATGHHPNIDFALTAVARVLRLPPHSGLTLFAIGRTIGWIGHAIEQYATGQLIRPRARYIGVMPGQGRLRRPDETSVNG
ncbi:MAG TPA: citrate synthase [Vicinamibacterales bacterium]|nr:citrate synthase [Vicinamibacterales bacterium]